jgi:hypothetical protein
MIWAFDNIKFDWFAKVIIASGARLGVGGGRAGNDGEPHVKGDWRSGGQFGVGRSLAADVEQVILTRFLGAAPLHVFSVSI